LNRKPRINAEKADQSDETLIFRLISIYPP